MTVVTASKLSPAQRSANFNLATRMYEQTATQMNFEEGSTKQITLDKSRFGAKLYLMVEGTFKATHASKTSFSKSIFDKYNILKQIRVNYNSSFNPFQISGKMLYLYNKLNQGKNESLDADVYGTDVLESVVSSTGTVNKIAFTLELPFTINDRDTIGLINLQNQETNVNLQLDCGEIKSVMTDTDVAISEVNITMTPILKTFSIPALPDAIPDYSILKLVNEDNRQIIGNGEQRFSLQTGLTYRKLLVYVTSDGVTPLTADKVVKFQLAFNQADTPISVPAKFIAYKNKKEYQGSLPVGCYVLDFSDAGFPNYAGSRDYVDTEKLTQFDLVVTFTGLTGSTNTIIFVPEKLATLQ